MPDEVALPVAVDVQPPHHAAVRHGMFPDSGANRPSLPCQISGLPHVDRLQPADGVHEAQPKTDSPIKSGARPSAPSLIGIAVRSFSGERLRFVCMKVAWPMLAISSDDRNWTGVEAASGRYGQDDVAALVPLVDVRVRLDDPLQRVGSVNNRLERALRGEAGQFVEVRLREAWHCFVN